MKLAEYLDQLTGSQYFIDEALVLGPYPTAEFFKNLSARRKFFLAHTPKSLLTVLADDGWDNEQLEMISATYDAIGIRSRPKVNVQLVASSDPCGLVHAKIIYLILKNEAESYTKRLMLIGSANASRQGFGVHAETYIHIDLADIEISQRRQMTSYIDRLKLGDKTSELNIDIGRGSWLQLPAIRPANKHRKSGFDAWLRQGLLCHKYQPDTSFGRLKLVLEEPLPPREFEEYFTQTGFGREIDIKGFSRPYVAVSELDEGDVKSVWRDRYFIETYYGFWTSQECFKECGSEFVASKSEERKETITSIAEATAAQHQEWQSEFEKNLTELVERIKQKNDIDFQVEKFFKTRSGEIDLESYREQAQKRLDADQMQANDSGFESRYTLGYSFERVPKMDDNFDRFAEDWCQSIIVKLNKRNSNKIAKEIRILVGDKDSDALDSPKLLLAFLRREWDTIQSKLTAFYG
jgi:hypothetical protein